MTSAIRLRSSKPNSRVLVISAVVAFFLELTLLTATGIYDHWLAHPHPTGLNPADFLEAEMVQVPEQPKLEEEKAPAPAVHETVLSKVPGKGKEAKPEEKNLEDKNQTQSRTPLGPTHGPVAVFAPQPSIPTYMQNQNLKASVVIDFYVNALGGVTPRLVGSSGNEELDAIALGAAKKWQFRPAENNHKPIDAKVRLRIIFQVQ